jgi:DNA-binding SARP family transcriptional activator
MGLAMTRLYLGEADRAAALCEESLTLCREVGDERSIAGALTSLGMVALARGDQTRAEQACHQSLEIRRALGDRGGMAHSLTILGGIFLERGEVDAAMDAYREALALRRETGDSGGTPGPLEGLAAVAAIRGDAAMAVRLFDAAAAFRSRHDTPSTPIELAFRDRYRELACARLGDAGVTGLHSALGDADLDQLVTSALASERIAPPEHASAEEAAVPTDSDTTTAPAPLRLDIKAFGEISITRDGALIEANAWTYAKARELLYFLLCMGPSTKEQIGAALWPDASETQLRSAFHSALHHLRRALGDPEWIIFRGGRYSFNRARSFSYDVGQFEQELSRARGNTSDRSAAIALLERAVDRYSGDYLEGLTETEWHSPKQQELERARTEALLVLGDLLLAEGQVARAVVAYRRAVSADPLLESAHRGLMRCYARQGERGLALRHYQELAEMLRSELATEPDGMTHALVEALRQGLDPA